MMPASSAASSSVTSFADLREVETGGRLDAVGAVAEQHVVRVEGEDLALRVALLDLDGDDRLFDLPFEADVAGLEADGFGKKVARELLCERARAGGPRGPAGRHVLHPLKNVARQRDGDARDAQTEVPLEIAVFGGNDGLAQTRGDVVVADHEAALGGELADRLAVGRVNARDGVRGVVVER